MKLIERREEIESYTQNLFNEINKVRNGSKGISVRIRQIGAENEISFLIGEKPAETEWKGHLKYDNDVAYEIDVCGFHKHDESVCAAIVVLGKALRIPVSVILELYQSNRKKMPHSFTDPGHYLHKILDKAVWEHWEEKFSSKLKKKV